MIIIYSLFSPQIVTALGQTWHSEHFVCAKCQRELGTQTFFERDGQAYCEEDYHNLFAPKCAYCHGPIKDVSRNGRHLLL